MSDAARLMDRIYARQRYIYDATRKFYLLGRDGLIAKLDPPPGARVLEIGCGTGRNLIAIAQRYPNVLCYGVDISEAMLATARSNVRRAVLNDRIALAQADATSFDPLPLFSVPHFDRVVISYALSMIPPWREALSHGVDLVGPGGALHVVDFGDQAGLPKAFKQLLETWLAAFHVTPRVSLPEEIETLAIARNLRAATASLFRGYAVRAALVRSSVDAN